MGSSSLREVLSGGWLSSSRCRCSSLEPAWQAFSTRVGRWRPCNVRTSETNLRKVKKSGYLNTWTEQIFTRTTLETASPTSSLQVQNQLGNAEDCKYFKAIAFVQIRNKECRRLQIFQLQLHFFTLQRLSAWRD